jgi:hypothetical protein
MPDFLVPAFLVDIDGTLANTEHRMHLLPEGDNRDDPAAWQKFHALMDQDQPYWPVFNFIRDRCVDVKLAPVVITGRPEEFKLKSSRWLVKHGFLPHHSIYRADDDRRPDTEYKADALRRMRHEGFLMCGGN